MTNSIIADNSGNALPASAVYVNSGQANLVNCTIAYNGAEGLNVAGGSALVLNSILFNNNYYTGPGYLSQIVGTTNVSYCDVQNGYAGTGNINFSPIFRSRADLMIVRPSKCLDAGSTNAVYDDVSFPPSLGTPRNDIGAHGGPGAGGWYSVPTILMPLGNQYAVTNTSVCISAGAAGASPLSYQWYRGTNLLTGQTDSSLCFSSVQQSDQGSYSVVVTNLYGAVSSPAVTLFVTTNGAAVLDIRCYAGVHIFGLPGRTYSVSYTTDVGPSPTWTPLATNTMTVPNWFFLDMDSPFQPRRFYHVELK
ncbi:MAG: hypothetical protein HZA90_15425 [Verrucomicrobia bacterium]|nr:hypothetical protein [Verrucomicrobiota bacterium]